MVAVLLCQPSKLKEGRRLGMGQMAPIGGDYDEESFGAQGRAS